MIRNTSRKVISTSRSLFRFKSTFAITCPGQGVIQPGFLLPYKSYSNHFESLLSEIDESLGESFTPNLFNSSSDFASNWLMKTSNAQPAILITTFVIHKLLKDLHNIDLFDNSAFILGHSLGEYLALCLNGVIDLTTAVKLVRKRGQLMENLNLTEQGMIALIINPRRFNDILGACKEKGVLANINSYQQIVLLGDLSELNLFIDGLKQSNPKSILKSIQLPVSIPFHSSKISVIEPELLQLVSFNSLGKAKVPIISNLTGDITSDETSMVNNTINVNSNPVDWVGSIETCINSNVTDLINLGPGEVLQGLNGKFKIRNHALSDLNGLENFAKTIRLLNVE